MHISANAKRFQGKAADAPEVIEHPERDFETGFDYRVHIRDAKTSRLIKYQPYATHINAGETLLERPIGSGNAYYPNGNSAGRWDFKLWKKLADTHIEAKNPSANPMEDLQERNAALEAELEALKAEKAQKKS